MPTTEFVLQTSDGRYFDYVHGCLTPELISAKRYMKKPSAKTIREIESYYGVTLTAVPVPA